MPRPEPPVRYGARGRLRVALATGPFEAGGLETMLLGLGAGLRAAGLRVEFLTSGREGAWHRRPAVAGFPSSHVGQRFPRKPLHVADLARAGLHLRRLAPDVLLLNHAWLYQGALAMLPEHVVALPVIHNHLPDIYAVACSNSAAWNACVAVGPRLAQTARALVPGRPVIQIPNGVPVPPAQPPRRPPGPLEVAFVGRLEDRQKGVFWLPEILAACVAAGVDARLTVGGDGPDRAELERRVRDAGLADRVRFAGLLTPAQVSELLGSAHVLLLPSRYEGLPMVPLEAGARGCVPVLSRLPGITDAVVREGESGLLFPVGDVAAAAGALARLAREPELMVRLAAGARARVVERFSVESMTRGYLALFDECLAGRHPLPRPRRLQPPVRARRPWLRPPAL